MSIIVCVIAVAILLSSALDVLDDAHRQRLKREERDRKKRKYK